MKRFLFLVALCIACIPTYSQTTGGPDAFGYVWRNNANANGPTYNWIDITGIGTQVSGLADDNSVGPFNLNWDFHYYWTDQNQIRIGSNGWISFDNVSNIAHCFPTIPQAGGQADNYLAPFMSDLNFAGTGNPGQVWFYTNNVDTAIISYLGVPFWVNATPSFQGNNNFQVILSGADSSITFQYGRMETSFNNTTCVADNESGIENLTGSIGLEVTNEVIPQGTSAVKFYFPDSVLISVRDLSPVWNQNTANGGVFLPAGLINLRSNVKNAGNDNITSASTITGQLRNLSLLQQYSATVSIPTFPAGFDTTVTFTPSANITTPGQYYFDVTSINNTDINPANDLNSTEINLVDLSGPSATLTYSTGGQNTATLSWSGGGNDDGAGVYMEPPVYPITLDTLEFFLTVTASDTFRAVVYDDNGPNGGPGTVLFSQDVPVSTLNSNTWNEVALSTPQTISAGGFYVAWFQGGANITLGTEDVGPISKRSYEILANSWATYRENTTRDLLIRVDISGYPCGPRAGFSNSPAANVVSFTNSSTGGTSYLWDFGDGNTSTALNPTHTYSAAGTYTVCLTTTNVCGSDSTCSSVTVTCPLPRPAFSFNQQGISFNFSDNSTGASSWLWDFGDGNTSTQQNPTHTYAATGTYTVCLTATGVCGSDSTCMSVTACILPNANFVPSTSGPTVTFANISSAGTSYFWDFGDGNSSTQQSPTHSYNGSGTYTVCLTVSNSCGADTLCSNVTINCPTPVAGFSATGSTLNYSFTDNSTGASSWLWDFGDGNTSTQQNPSHTYTSGGTYTVCLTATNACGSDSSCTVVSPCEVPQSSFSFTLTGPGNAFSFSDQSSGSPNTWLWDFGDGNTSTQQNPSHTYTTNDTFTVCLISSSACGADTSCQDVIADAITGLTGAQPGFRISVYPIPAREILALKYESIQRGQVRLMDLRGKALRVLPLETGAGEIHFEVASLAAGMYILEFSNQDFRKVIKVPIEH